MGSDRRATVSLKTKQVLMLVLTVVTAVVVNLGTSALDSGRTRAAVVYAAAVLVTAAVQVYLAVFTTTTEEQRLALLQDAQDVRFRNEIRESEAISAQIVLAVTQGDHPQVLKLQALRRQLWT